MLLLFDIMKKLLKRRKYLKMFINNSTIGKINLLFLQKIFKEFNSNFSVHQFHFSNELANG